MAKKPKLLFVYDIEDEDYWKDGLWAAIELLKKDFDITKLNIEKDKLKDTAFDFVLGWGAFGSPADIFVQNFSGKGGRSYVKSGLCIAGNAQPPGGQDNYDVLFYETEWYKTQISSHKNIVHAFGVNTDIFKDLRPSYESPSGDPIVEDYPILFDYLTVGAFALWKRQSLICAKNGSKMAIGQIQKNNMAESIDIVGNLLLEHCAVSDMVLPEKLAEFYNCAETVCIPADINGGGERAVLEARACGVKVEIEPDNPKLKELLTSPIWDHKYYKKQLKKGIMSVL